MKNYLTLMVLLASANASDECTDFVDDQLPQCLKELYKEAENSPYYNDQQKKAEATVSSQASKATNKSRSADIPSTKSPQYNPQYTGGNIGGAIQSGINYGLAHQDGE